MNNGASASGHLRLAGGETPLCLVPADLEHMLEALAEALPHATAVLERRLGDRRRVADRRVSVTHAPPRDRRLVHNPSGRRVAERRCRLTPTAPPHLPRDLKGVEDRLRFVERVLPGSEFIEDVDTARLVIRIQAGETEAFARIYERYLDRVYGYLRLLLRHEHDAEDASQETFSRALRAIPGYELRRQPFRAWLFTIARNEGMNVLRRRSRVEPIEPLALSEHNSSKASPEQRGWVSDADLLRLIERLPLSQRQVLVLRYQLDLSNIEIAQIIGRSRNDVAVLHRRALRFLGERLGPLRSFPAERRGLQAVWVSSGS